MKLAQILAVAALLNTDIEGVSAIRRHHHHHHHRPRFVQVDKNEDILQKDPKWAELQKKKVAIKDAIEEELIKQFDLRAEILSGSDFTPVDVNHVEVNMIQNVPFGVPGFWLKALVNNKNISHEVHERDRPILGYL